jgi:hypothetical protein
MIMVTLLLSLPLSAALISRYSFNATGDPNLIDSIGGKTGKVMGGATQSGGKLVLTGTVGDYAQLPANILGSSPVSATLEFWYTYTNSGWVRVFDFGNSSGGNGGYYLLYTPCGAGSRFVIGTKGYPGWSTGEEGVGGATVAIGTRVHIACVFDNAAKKMSLYQNGVLLQSGNVTQLLANLQQVYCYLGKSNYGSTDPVLAGTIDEFRIYDSAATTHVILDAQTNSNPDVLLTTVDSMTPDNASTMVAPDPITFNWTPTAGISVKRYEVFVKTDPNLLDPNTITIPAGTPDYSGPFTICTKAGTFATTYYWRVDIIANDDTRYPGPRFSFTTAQKAPVFTVNPAGTSAKLGGSAAFTATCSRPASYPLARTIQWFKVNTPDVEVTAGADVTITETLSGTLVTSTLTLSNIAAEQAGNYYAKATNSEGTAQSTNATLAIQRLVARYEFEDNTNDTTGAFNGTLTGTGLYETGKILKAINLDGTTNYITLPTGVDSFNDITVCTWVYWRGGNNWQRLFDFGAGTSYYMFLTPNNGSEMRFVLKNNGGEQVTSTTPLATNQWVHLAATLSGDTAKIYVNGALVKTNTGVTINPSDFVQNAIYIGKSQYADALFNGSVDDFRIYNYGLPASEVSDLYLALEPFLCSAPITYDLNGDCRVNLADFALLASQWLNCNRQPESTCIQ